MTPALRDAVQRMVREVAGRHGLPAWEMALSGVGRPDIHRARCALAYRLRGEVGLESREISDVVGVAPSTVCDLIRAHCKTIGAAPLRLAKRETDDGTPWPALAEAAAAPAWRARFIATAVADRYGVPRDVMLGPSRERRAVLARWAAAWWLMRITRLSTPQIGRVLGGRHHTTVLAAERSHMALHGLPRARLQQERCAA